jgi:uncharacterized protein DUF4157/glutaminase-like protein/annexin-like protein
MSTRSRTSKSKSTDGLPHSHAGPSADPKRTGSLIDLNGAIGNQTVLGLIRAKLKLSQPTDPHEREADLMADRLVSPDKSPESGDGAVSISDQARRGPSASATSQVPSLAVGAGFGLDPATRAAMEPHFGADFGSVRVHTGPEAQETAETLGARAFTLGHSIGFGRGEYAPGTGEGQRLIAHELTHVVRGSSSETVNRKPPPELNYENLADRVYEAIAGLGTDEEQVYLALQMLNRDPDAIAELERVYADRHHESLDAAIRDDFSGTELEYALQLLNRGTPGSAQSIQGKPVAAADFDSAARRIRDAVEGLGTDEEAIYSVLLPFGRNMKLINQLETAYQALYGEQLSARIDEEMSGSQLDYALYLMGGPAVRANVEIAEVSMAEAQKLFAELSRLSFWTDTNEEAPVPFHYPTNGCFDRAYVMEQRMTELGYASEKVFAVSMTPSGGGNLRVRSDYAANAPAGTPPTVKWWYHVAPVIRVRTAAGSVEEMVMDPSLASGPISIRDWTRMMNTAAFDRIPASEIRSLVDENNGSYPRNRNMVFTTDRDVYDPGVLGEAEEPGKAWRHHQEKRRLMADYSREAQVHELAASIRRELRSAPVSVDQIVAAINAATGFARSRLWADFPDLRLELEAIVTDPADRARIATALGSP